MVGNSLKKETERGEISSCEELKVNLMNYAGIQIHKNKDILLFWWAEYIKNINSLAELIPQWYI